MLNMLMLRSEVEFDEGLWGRLGSKRSLEMRMRICDGISGYSGGRRRGRLQSERDEKEKTLKAKGQCVENGGLEKGCVRVVQPGCMQSKL